MTHLQVMKVVLAFLLCATVAMATKQKAHSKQQKPEEQWANGYDQPLHYECRPTESISMVISQHSNHYEDRQWDFSCKNTFTSATCSWSGYANNFDQEFTYICPFDSVMSGMESYHDSKQEDRRWKFYCCKGEVLANLNCKWSGYVNDFDAYMRWDAPVNAYLTGAHSYHNNYYEDRLWEFYYCEKSATKRKQLS